MVSLGLPFFCCGFYKVLSNKYKYIFTGNVLRLGLPPRPFVLLCRLGNLQFQATVR